MNSQKLTACFEYLDRLRESGITNMWGAGPYVREAMSLKEEQAREVHRLWMESFNHEQTPRERALLSMEKAKP